MVFVRGCALGMIIKPAKSPMERIINQKINAFWPAIVPPVSFLPPKGTMERETAHINHFIYPSFYPTIKAQHIIQEPEGFLMEFYWFFFGYRLLGHSR